jgi:hypothetical protein
LCAYNIQSQPNGLTKTPVSPDLTQDRQHERVPHGKPLVVDAQRSVGARHQQQLGHAECAANERGPLEYLAEGHLLQAGVEKADPRERSGGGYEADASEELGSEVQLVGAVKRRRKGRQKVRSFF